MISPDKKYFESVIRSLLRNEYQQKVVFFSTSQILHHKATKGEDYLLTDLLSYLLHGAVILDKLIGSHLVTNFLSFYGTRRFSTVFTGTRKYLDIF
jgi:hypothetical protein